MDGDVSIDPLARAAHLVENRVTPHDLGVARFVPPQTRSEEALHGVDVARLERRGHAPVQLSIGVLQPRLRSPRQHPACPRPQNALYALRRKPVPTALAEGSTADSST